MGEKWDIPSFYTAKGLQIAADIDPALFFKVQQLFQGDGIGRRGHYVINQCNSDVSTSPDHPAEALAVTTDDILSKDDRSMLASQHNLHLL